MTEQSSLYDVLPDHAVDELKRKSVRGGVFAVCAQVVKVVLQTATLALLARMLSAQDFGLQAMVVALTGFLSVFREGGLGAATVQRREITHQQISTIFWVNVAVGVALAAVSAALAPAAVWFYGEPRLTWIVVVSGVAFVFTGLAAQHRALLLRDMRIVTLAKIELASLAISSAVGVIMAFFGFRYWSLVGMAVGTSIVGAAGVWLAVPWVPGLPRRHCGVLSILRFGWMATCNNLVFFLAWNSHTILIGRFFGADALGVYGRAFQLATLPIMQLNSALEGMAFSGLSRIQSDATRFAKSFLSGFSLLVSLTVPIAISSVLFADEIVRVVLGPNWTAAAPIFRLLAPTSLVFAMTSPLSLLLMASGRAGRALTISAVTTPVVIGGMVLGMSYGTQGVALGYSSAMAIVFFPIAIWCIQGTPVTCTDLWNAVKQPLAAGILAGATCFIAKSALGNMLTPVSSLLVGLCVILGVYASALAAMGQKALYADLLIHVFRRAPSPQ